MPSTPATLTRALEVSEVLSGLWNLEPRPEGSLREIRCGRIDGMPIEDIKRDYPELWARNQTQADDDFRWPAVRTTASFAIE